MIFIDTGAFIARYVVKDQYHQEALQLWQKAQSRKCVTSNHVIDETLTLLARRTDYGFAAETGSRLYRSAKLQILHTSAEEEREAVSLFAKYADQQLSFTDCLSFVLMENHGINEAFTFDKHFELLGFHRLQP